MNTSPSRFKITDITSFRFLYGRWIQYDDLDTEALREGSDSSMVDEYARYL